MLTIEKFPGEAIIVITYDNSILKDMVSTQRVQTQQKIRAIIEETPGLDYLILDLQGVDISFSELVMVLAAARDQFAEIGGKAFIDNNIRYLFAGSDELIDLAAEALSQEQYGNIQVRVFPTVDKAVDFARRELANEISPMLFG